MPSGLLPLKSDTQCLESKAKGRSLDLSQSQVRDVVSWSALCRREGGGDALVAVVFILRLGRKLKKRPFATSVVRKEV